MKIKEFILRSGIKSQEELAGRLGIQPATVYAWTAGTRKPGWDMIVALYELGMTTEEIFEKAYLSSVKSSHDDLASRLSAKLDEICFKLDHRR